MEYTLAQGCFRVVYKMRPRRQKPCYAAVRVLPKRDFLRQRATQRGASGTMRMQHRKAIGGTDMAQSRWPSQDATEAQCTSRPCVTGASRCVGGALPPTFDFAPPAATTPLGCSASARGPHRHLGLATDAQQDVERKRQPEREAHVERRVGFGDGVAHHGRHSDI